VDSWYKDFAEDGFIKMFVDWYFATPMRPFIFLHTPEIVIAESSFREFNFYE
jgi:hypothetical protein